MFRDNKRVTWRQRRLIRHLSRSRHASVQDAAVHELHRSMRRSHGLFPPKAPGISSHGTYRPLTRRAKSLLSRLKGARQWSVKKNILGELAREMKNGKRLIDRVKEKAQRAAARAERAMERAGRAASRAGRAVTRKDGAVRRRVIAGQERLLSRAERKQGERLAGKRKPALSTRARRAVRSRLPGRRPMLRGRPRRALDAWKQRRRERLAPSDPGWERSRYNPQSPRYRPLAVRTRNRGRGPRPVPARRRTAPGRTPASTPARSPSRTR